MARLWAHSTHNPAADHLHFSHFRHLPVMGDRRGLGYSIEPFQFFNLLQGRASLPLVVIDCRESEQFELDHVPIALSIPPSTDYGAVPMEKIVFQSQKKSVAISKLRNIASSLVVVCGVDGSTFASDLTSFLSSRATSCCILPLPQLERFLSDYPFLTVKGDASGMMPGPFPAEIIPNLLYLGGQSNAESRTQLDLLGITAVVNCAGEMRNYFEGEGIHYKKLMLQDTLQQDISDLLFDEVCGFIEECARKKARVLVHCAHGQSRSASFVTSYIMKSKGWGLTESLDYVRLCKEDIRPNATFVKHLQRFEKKLTKQATVNTRTALGYRLPFAAISGNTTVQRTIFWRRFVAILVCIIGGLLNRGRGGWFDMAPMGYWTAQICSRIVPSIAAGLFFGLLTRKPSFGVIVALGHFISLFVGWESYMNLGFTDGVKSPTGVFDWVVGREQQDWAFYRRWARDFPALTLRGLVWTMPCGYTLRRAGFTSLPALSGGAMGLVYHLSQYSHSTTKNFEGGVPLAEMFWGIFVWACLAIAALSPKRMSGKRSHRKGGNCERWRLPLGRLFEIFAVMLSLVCVISVCFYATVQQSDLNGWLQTLLGLLLSTVLLVTQQFVTLKEWYDRRQRRKNRHSGVFDIQRYQGTCQGHLPQTKHEHSISIRELSADNAGTNNSDAEPLDTPVAGGFSDANRVGFGRVSASTASAIQSSFADDHDESERLLGGSTTTLTETVHRQVSGPDESVQGDWWCLVLHVLLFLTCACVALAFALLCMDAIMNRSTPRYDPYDQ